MNEPVTQLIAAGRLQQAYIKGAWVPVTGTDSLALTNPSTEQVFAQLRLGSRDDSHSAVQAARNAFNSGASGTVAQRLALLSRILELITARQASLAQILSFEMGAAIQYARTAHVPLAAAHVRAAIANLAQYEFIKMRGTTAIVREPIGVAALITPWNWPLYQITAKVAPAIAAGCSVVLKASELSPLSALAFAEIMHDAGTPAGVFNLVNGDGAGVGAALSLHPDVDMISITGSTRAGILVAQAAAATVKRVAQELGGKSPNILLPDADFNKAVALGVAACFRNCGQSCSAPTRMLVPRERLAQVEQLALAAAADIVMGPANDETVTHGPLANRAQFSRVQQMIEIGINEGARLVCGGTGRPTGFTQGFFTKPTIFSDVTPAMTIAREEIFGPVLCIMPYDSIEQAVAMANDSVFGLGAHVQSGSLQQARAIALRLRTGQVHINHPAWDPHAPFGGYKQSGTGREYGIEGIEEYLEIKSIVGFGQDNTQTTT